MNNKTRLRNEIKNLYGGANKFLTNAEINKLVEKSTGQNNLNIKKEAYKQAYSKYYNHVFDDILYQAFMRMKASPQCPTGVNSEPIRKAAERAIRKKYGTGTTYAAAGGAAIGAVAGRGINVVGRGAAAAAQGVVRTAEALAQLCKQNPTHSECNGGSSGNNNSNSNNNGNNQPRRPNGRPSRSTAGQPPARIANSNRKGAPKAWSR